MNRRVRFAARLGVNFGEPLLPTARESGSGTVSVARQSVEALLSFRLVAHCSTFPHTPGFVPHQALVIVGERRFGVFAGSNTVSPIGRADSGKTGEASGSSLQTRKSDGD